MAIIVILFFIPSLTSFVDFIYYLYFGDRLVSGLIAGLLDFFNLIIAPFLYFTFLSLLNSKSVLVFEPPYLYISLAVIILSVAGYFLLQTVSTIMTSTQTIIILISLALGIFLNVALIIDEISILTVFHLAIIFTYFISIGTHADKLVQPHYPKQP
jgi:hypothetical protein